MCCYSYIFNQIGVLKNDWSISKDPRTCAIHAEVTILGKKMLEVKNY